MNRNGDYSGSGVKVLVEAAAFLGFFVGGFVFLFKGVLPGSIRLASIVAGLPHYWEMFLTALEAVLAAVVALALLVGLGLLLVRHGRAWAGSAAAVWWRYRRRWASVLTAHGLTGSGSGSDRRRKVPPLRDVASGPGIDVLRVGMLPGQSPADWDHAAAGLAAAFGASAGRARVSDTHHGDIDLEFTHTPSAGVPAGRPPHDPVLLGAPQPVPERDLVAIVRARSVRLSWARIVWRDHDGRSYRPSWWGRVKWNVNVMSAGVYAPSGGI